MTAPASTRFTAVDETADLMERRGEPNLIYLELAVAGRLDPDRLRAAVHTAFAAHPATRSRRLPAPPWRPRSRWQVEPQPATDPLTVRTGPALDLDTERRALLDQPLDLRQPPLLRLRLLHGTPEGDHLLLVAHHAGFDGMGFVGVLLAICAAYNGAEEAAKGTAGRGGPADGAAPAGAASDGGVVDGAACRGGAERDRAARGVPGSGEPPASGGRDVGAVDGGAGRGGAVPDGAVPGGAAPGGAAPGGAGRQEVAGYEAGRRAYPSRPDARRRAAEAAAAARPALLPPRPVRVAREPAAGRRRGYGLAPLGFDVGQAAALARAAKAAGVTLNDLLLAALGLAVTRWNALHSRPVEPLRITMPVNTRDPRARHLGDGNHSRLTSIDIDAAGRDARTALAAVAARTVQAKGAPAGPQGGPAAVVLGAPWLPRGLRRVLAPCVRFAARSFADTTMLSNLGPLTELPRALSGAGEITELWAAAPAPMPRGLSVTALGANGRLHLMIRHRFEALDAPAAAAFTELFADAVHELAELAASEEAAAAPACRPAGADALAAPAAASRRTEGNP
ncbi:hypothetical protein [Streptacidiphilus anmyonensis]|uniref:hypothetical protein n=1 Tax=Streptacidiphilus anmyonensis TaxID=405782 RepID=UPI00069443E7|nr:hypothetical protein [Streptacidiphilus anmyonensis]